MILTASPSLMNNKIKATSSSPPPPPPPSSSSSPEPTMTTNLLQMQLNTLAVNSSSSSDAGYGNNNKKRSIEELSMLVKQENFDPTMLSNDEIIKLMLSRQVSVYKLESILGKSNAKRCVEVRRQFYIRELELLDKLDTHNNNNQIYPCHEVNDDEQQQQHHHLKTTTTTTLSQDLSSSSSSAAAAAAEQLTTIQHQQQMMRADILKRPQTTEFEYDKVVGACCENVVGYVRLPVGLVGPLKLDNQTIYVPLATTEGCLVASTSRGLSALAKSGGVISRVRKNCMTRAPIVRFQDPELSDALKNVDRALDWLQDPIIKEKLKLAFRSNSRHTKLMDYSLHPIGREIHIRFEAQTGDAMGMNMCSKGAEMALKEMQRVFPTMDILTLSGNLCTDKKPSAINWTCGRGKSVECNALLSAEVVEKVFKVPIDSLIEVWLKKVMVGSAMAGSIGGFNCHASNIVAAIFIATGQDVAQVVSSSNCLLVLEKDSRGSLAVHCSMPSIECGTIGGGTVLPDQSNYLQIMGIKGSTTTIRRNNNNSTENNSNNPINSTDSDSNACKLARIICATVMAAELSLLASLTEGTLVKSHMTHNRSSQPCKVV